MGRIYTLIIVLLIFIGTTLEKPCKAQVNVGDSLALVAFYNSTGGPSWTNNSNWLVSTVDTWYGITVSGVRVTEIILLDNDNGADGSLEDGNNLIGTIAPELGGLTALQGLGLSFNQLTGSIPPELGNLINLQYLDLSVNQLSGPIPPELANLLNLQWLGLNKNQLSGPIPSGIGSLTNLQNLFLFDNQLTGSVPPELGSLANLLELDLSNNQLSGSVPPELGNLSNLLHLGLSNNQFTGSIPQELSNLSNLIELSLNNNQISGPVPIDLGTLLNLLDLWLGNNQLSGSIPPELGNLPNLEYLGLSSNQLVGSIPIELSNLSNLIWLALGKNNLTGTIPPVFINLVNLEFLGLNNNQLTGTIPLELGGLSNLKLLWLYGNQLTGSIPVELGNLSNLLTIGLSFNQLTGTIPTELGNLSNLTWLDVGANPLTGTVPIEIGNLLNLQVLLLHNCQFTGSVPLEFINLSLLDTFVFNNTSLCEPSTAEYISWKSMMSRYEGTGAICNDPNPPIVIDSLALVTLYNATAGDNWVNNTNWLTGPVDSWYGVVVNNIRVLEVMLNDNNLAGPIPPDIGSITRLLRLELQNNQLTGTLPSEFSQNIELISLNIENNELTDLPELEGLDSLVDFRITDNRFTYSDILPNLSFITNNTSQKPFGGSLNVTGYTFEALRIDPKMEFIDGQQYEWFLDSVPVASGNEHYLDIDQVLNKDAGTYQLLVTHPDVPGLVLSRMPILLTLNEGDPPKPVMVKVISPNGDGINDEATIKNIEFFPDHRVLIYNVLGKLVYETTNYDNINNPFIGIGNVNGREELPSGTYYYVVDVGDNKKNGTGFFIMKKQ